MGVGTVEAQRIKLLRKGVCVALFAWFDMV
jgi:hypothetical protein